MTTTPTLEELRQQLADAEAKDAQATAERFERFQAAQHAWRKDLLSRAKTIESDLEQQEQAAYHAATAAAAKLDLSEAVRHYGNMIAFRAARGSIRSSVQGAAHVLGKEPPIAADLRYIEPDFNTFLNTAITTYVNKAEVDLRNEYISEMPTDPTQF